MTWTFQIDALAIEEPIGFSEILLRVKRDDQWHGLFFEAGTSDLQFYGAAANYLRNLKQTQGFSAEATFKAITDCGGEDEVLTGKLDFRQYKEKCGVEGCLVTMAVEQEGCTMTLRNRYDQKVDLSDQVAFDKLTVLPDYNGLNFTMQLAAQEIQVGNRAETGADPITSVISDDPEWVTTGDDDFVGYISPAYADIKNSSLGTFGTTPDILVTPDGANNIPPYPAFPVTTGTATLLGDIICDLNSAVATFRHKGVINIQQSGAGALQYLRLKLWRLPAGLDASMAANWIEEYNNEFYGANIDGPVAFDVSATVPITLNQGDFIYYGVFVINNDLSNITSFNYQQDPESFFDLSASTLCPETDAVVSLVHEAASRVTEAITDRCLTVKSDYYGRTDSQPYAALEDGCGSLRVLTSGLRLRNAETPKHFVSLKDVFDGLNGIDNIGIGVEGSQLRIEPTEYFYQDVEILRHRNIPRSDFALDPDDAYSIVKIGYKKWETESVNGLDEFNSNKEFRTSLKSISNTLDVTSPFIAGGYPIEKTRQQSFAETGAADTKYDNDTFIIVVTRDAYGYEVEQGVIVNASGFYSPGTAYNWRIRPMYNLMRWWKSIAQSYVNLANTAARLFFASGTGNIVATGELTDDCNVAAVNKPENGDLSRNDMLVGKDPLYKAENVTYRYPMSLKEYNLVKLNPRGYVSFQCGDGDFQKGFITNIAYRVARGEAELTLKLKWSV